jgi:hypothetical protein
MARAPSSWCIADVYQTKWFVGASMHKCVKLGELLEANLGRPPLFYTSVEAIRPHVRQTLPRYRLRSIVSHIRRSQNLILGSQRFLENSWFQLGCVLRDRVKYIGLKEMKRGDRSADCYETQSRVHKLCRLEFSLSTHVRCPR